jgi:hypothetical protein
MALMGAVAASVKRNVIDPVALQAIYSELEAMRTGSTSIDSPDVERLPEDALIVHPSVAGPSGGASREALRRTRNARKKAMEQAVAEP